MGKGATEAAEEGRVAEISVLSKQESERFPRSLLFVPGRWWVTPRVSIKVPPQAKPDDDTSGLGLSGYQFKGSDLLDVDFPAAWVTILPFAPG